MYDIPYVEHSANSATVVANNPRPLWMAVVALRHEYGWLIDYEDPIYRVGDTQEVRNAERGLRTGVSGKEIADAGGWALQLDLCGG
jgi:hypothetical protein